MSYSYAVQRPWVLTEEGQTQVFAVLAHARACCAKSGAVRMQELQRGITMGAYDGWNALAIADRLVELGELREVSSSGTPGQHRVFVLARG